MAQQLRANRQDRLRWAVGELLRLLGQEADPNEPATRELLRDMAPGSRHLPAVRCQRG